MLFKTIALSDKYPDCTLTLMVHDEDSSPRPAVVVCPGGGYRFLSLREAQPIAEYYYNAGMNAYILRYSVAPLATHYRPIIQAALAVKFVRQNAAEHNTAPDKIVTCGFSAGGHLAASAGILWNIPEVREAVGVTCGSAPEGINRPNGMILSYPVILAGKNTHQGSICNLSGKENYDQSDIEKFSLDLRVDKTAPPMFIWHTVTDTTVPIHSAVAIVNAYVNNGLSFEAHIYPNGPHGLSLCNEITWEGAHNNLNPHAETWAELSLMWMKDIFD